MKKLLLGAAILALIAGPASAANLFSVTLSKQTGDGDETKLFFNQGSLVNDGVGATFDGEVKFNGGIDDVDIATVGLVKTLGNGFGTITGVDTPGDFFTQITFTPTSLIHPDGIMFRGQLANIDELDHKTTGTVHIAVTDINNMTTDLSFAVTKLNKDWGDELVEALDDKDQIKFVTFSTDPGQYFEEVKQIEFSGVAGVPEPSEWAILLTGFFGLGWLIRRRKALGQGGGMTLA
jgi:hypothetical protein